jgi:Tfp pilus assembly protein PilV
MKLRLAGQDGTTIIEVVIASAILVTLMAGLMSLAGLAISTTENQGHLAARTTEYAQDKMEQLLALAYGDTTSDTTVFPATSAGGTGLAVGGSSNTTTPVAKYVDYLDQSGNLCGSPSALAASPPCAAPSGTTPPMGWFYQRVWAVSQAGTNLKQVTVTATIARGFGGANKAVSVLTVLKTNPF